MKRMVLLAACGLALSAAAAMAQSPVPAGPQSQQHPNGAWQNGRRGGAGFGALLKGVSLSDAQKTQLQQMRKTERGAIQRGTTGQNIGQQIRAARQRGDTVAARQLMQQARTQMKAQRDQQIAAIRGMLTPDQQAQFDKNVAAMRQRETQGRGRGQGRNGFNP